MGIAKVGSGKLDRLRTMRTTFRPQPLILLYVAVAALYAASLWLRPPRVPPATPMAIVALALVVHAVTIVRAVFTPDGIDLSFPQALSLVAWLTVIVAVTSGLLAKLPAVGNVILPVAALCALFPLAGGPPHRFAYAGETWAAVHIAVALVGYAMFTVAALQALLLAGLEKRLHSGIARPDTDGTVPLLTLERFMFRLVGAGFVLLTLTIASGLVFSEEVFGKPVTLTHKNVFSVLGWVTFAVLLFGRWRYGWRGRPALYWILAGTALLVLGYLGSKFVSQVLLGR